MVLFLENIFYFFKGLESKCEMYGRLKKILKDKLTELEVKKLIFFF